MALSSFGCIALFLFISFASSLTQDPFSMPTAYDQLMLSYSAYCPPAKIQSWSCYFCKNYTDGKFEMVTTVSNSTTNIFGYVGYTGTTAQVIFRGTQVASLANWIEDLNFSHTSPYPLIPNAFVHTGFLDAWHSVKSQVVAAVKSIQNYITPTGFYFSGHSLGAALSVLAAIEIGAPLSVPVTCYNYGEPRVGNQAFAEYFNQKIGTTYRIVNKADIVPHLPPKNLGFWHIATEVWWKNNTYYKICNDSGEDPTCSDSILTPLSITDHLDYLGVPIALGFTSGCD
jgi:hypothetical protein